MKGNGAQFSQGGVYGVHLFRNGNEHPGIDQDELGEAAGKVPNPDGPPVVGAQLGATGPATGTGSAKGRADNHPCSLPYIPDFFPGSNHHSTDFMPQNNSIRGSLIFNQGMIGAAEPRVKDLD